MELPTAVTEAIRAAIEAAASVIALRIARRQWRNGENEQQDHHRIVIPTAEEIRRYSFQIADEE